MFKQLLRLLAVTALLAALCAAVFAYYQFISDRMFMESSVHLAEIYHQVNQTLQGLVSRSWSTMHMWTPYLKDAPSDDAVDAYISAAQKENGFTDFYFISHEGNYRTIAGKTGYLDLKDRLPSVILHGEDAVVSSVVPGQPEIMVFVVPAARGAYRGFNYEAIAISFNNSDLVKTLNISSFKGHAVAYVIHPDGRVIIDNANGQIREIYNFLGSLRNHSEMTEEDILLLEQDFRSQSSGVTTFRMDGRSYYLVYESAAFEDWILLGIVPTDVVNANMNAIQNITLLVVSGIAIIVALALIVYLVRQNHRRLRSKDMELLYREELFTTLSANVDDIFLMMAQDGQRVDYISPNIEKLLGLPPESARSDIRSTVSQVMTGDEISIFDQLPDMQPNEQTELDKEYIHLVTGEHRWFHITALCKEILGEKKYILVLSDRTQDKKTNQALTDAVNAARSANQAKSTFLSNMSHDIRTPMNAIVGFATLAVANVTNTEKVRDYLTKILSSSNHLLSLINDVLDMSRIESGKIHLEEQEANLSDIFHDLKTIISGQIHAKQLELYMDIMDVTDEDVFCDKTRLNQVLLNLLSNAIKFTAPGGTISVRVSQKPNAPEGKGLYEIHVKDTGIGMSPEFAQRIFDPFERERTSTVSRIQGTGLGMAISKNIIDMMGGTITLNTEQGKGTEFIVSLALKLQSQRRPVEVIKELVGLKGLVVDDDFNTCDSVTKMLLQVGMRSEWTMSGREAVLRARQSLEINDPFMAYIIDWRLPDMNGIEVTRQIRRLGDDTPIIILTAYDWTEIEVEARAAGVTAFCAKPMFMSDLRNSLLTALGQQKEEASIIPSAGEPAEFKGRRLLLAEDNELNREIAYEILTKYGFIIDTAENGAEAVKALEAAGPGRYDLILMDIQMPVMDGYEATRHIRALENPALASIPILAMTANAFDEDRRAAAACGMDGFLSKPINIDEVVETLHTVFRTRA